MRAGTYFTYIMAGDSGAMYVGMTGNLVVRLGQHKQELIPGFTQKYNLTRLVWYEPHSTVRAAISREKQIKGWGRMKKVALIEKDNPNWKDLSQRNGKSKPCHSERSLRSEESLFDLAGKKDSRKRRTL